MTTRDDDARFVFQRLVQRIDDPQNEQVIIVMVGKDRQVETAAMGATTELEMFWTLHHVLKELAEGIFEQLTPSDVARANLVVPTSDQIRQFRRPSGDHGRRGR